MSIRDAYTNWSATYDSDRNMTRDLDAVVTRQLLAGQQYTTILELGCGTGKNTVYLRQIGERVCALDFSEGMIAAARTKLAAEAADNVVFAVADLTQPWPIAAQSVDLIACNLVLEHISDLAFVFSEAHRVARTGGRFFVCELHPFKQYQGKQATFQRAEGQTDIPAFVHHLSAFLDAATDAGFVLKQLREWWHEADQGLPPRLASFMFEK